MKKAEFRRFYDKNIDRVYRFVFFRVSKNRDVAEDLTSEIFMKALSAFDRYDPKISETAWIMTIARNHLANHYRDRKAVEDIDDYSFKLEGEDGTVTAEKVDDLRRLREALNQLDSEEKEVIELKYIQGYKYKEIAEIIGKSAGAIRVEAHRAIKKLRKIYDDFGKTIEKIA